MFVQHWREPLGAQGEFFCVLYIVLSLPLLWLNGLLLLLCIFKYHFGLYVVRFWGSEIYEIVEIF